MDKGDNIDDWFLGEGYTAKGKRLLQKLEQYKADMKTALTEIKSTFTNVEDKFITDVKNKDGMT
jgi:hypothetical protein